MLPADMTAGRLAAGPTVVQAQLATGMRLFTNADTLYDDMLAAIAGARQRVWMETYIFAADELGWLFARALAARAQAGVEVRLLVDSAGALETPYSKRIRRYLKRAGVDLRWFNRLRRLLPAQINHRNHRKLLLVDYAYAYLGSSNIMWTNSRRLCGDGCTRQLDVRLASPRWRHLIESTVPLWQTGSTVSRRWQGVAVDATQLLASSPHDPMRPLRTLYRALFEQAQTAVYLVMAYFVPDGDTLCAVEDAARRGVDVHLILPGPAVASPPRWAAHALYARLLAAGVRIYEYMPGILHTKAAVVDGHWAVLGSGNFDYRSFYLNYELCLETRDAVFCDELLQAIRAIVAQCEEVTAASWRQRSWRSRMCEKLIWPFRRLL